jgi:hypothetical protein
MYVHAMMETGGCVPSHVVSPLSEDELVVAGANQAMGMAVATLAAARPALRRRRRRS